MALQDEISREWNGAGYIGLSRDLKRSLVFSLVFAVSADALILIISPTGDEDTLSEYTSTLLRSDCSRSVRHSSF